MAHQETLSAEEIYTNLSESFDGLNYYLHEILNDTLNATKAEPMVKDILDKMKKGIHSPNHIEGSYYIRIMDTIRNKMTEKINSLPDDIRGRIQERLRIHNDNLNRQGMTRSDAIDYIYILVTENRSLPPKVPPLKISTRPSSTTKRNASASLKRKRSQNSSPENNNKRGGGKATYTYKGHAYVIRIGDRGGKYILVNRKKIYV